jgi:predicted transcriptional regulator
VLQDPKSYEDMRNAIGILKLISQGEADIRSGKVRSQEEVFNDIDALLKKRL